jgi:hypothetical protein
MRNGFIVAALKKPVQRGADKLKDAAPLEVKKRPSSPRLVYFLPRIAAA